MFLKSCDFISPEITLYYKGRKRHTSINSGIISIILLIIIFTMSFFLSLDFLLKKNPSVFYYKKYTEKISKFYLNSSNLLHFIYFNYKNNDSFFIDENVFSIIGFFSKDIEKDINEKSYYIYKKCIFKNKINIELSNKYLSYYNNSFCIYSFYNYSNNEIIYYNNSKFIYPSLNQNYLIQINLCKNNSYLNNNSCYSNEEIENLDIYNQLYYNIIFKSNEINLEIFNNPIYDNYYFIKNDISYDYYIQNYLNFDSLHIKTHYGVFIEKTSEIYSYKYDRNDKLNIYKNDISNNIIGEFYFEFTNNINIYDRTFKLVQDIAGSIN